MNRPTEIWFGLARQTASHASLLLSPSPNFAERYVYLYKSKRSSTKDYGTSRRLNLDRRYREIP